MVKIYHLLVGILVFQTSAKAATNENSHSSITTNINKDGASDGELDNVAKHKIIDDDASRTQRQKRFYDYLGHGFPPYNFPSTSSFLSQSHYSKRDESQNTGVYGTEDALSLVYKRLHDIVRNVREQNVPRPPQTPIPAYIPVFYIPQLDCSCSTTNNQQPSPTVNKPTSRPVRPSSSYIPPNSNITPTENTVTIEDRFSEKDGTENEDGEGRRPINLNPVATDEPIGVPVPPVEHGTVQAGADPARIPSQSPPPRPPQNAVEYPLREPQDAIGFPPGVSVEQSKDSFDSINPSLCDGAIVSCCNQPRITDKCFELQGCQNPYIYGNPCDADIQLRVVNKFLNFQKRRASGGS